MDSRFQSSAGMAWRGRPSQWKTVMFVCLQLQCQLAGDLCSLSYRRIITRPTTIQSTRPTGCLSAGRPGWPRRRHGGIIICRSATVIYLHGVLSVLSIVQLPGRLLALMKKSAHETGRQVLQFLRSPYGQRFNLSTQSVTVPRSSHFTALLSTRSSRSRFTCIRHTTRLKKEMWLQRTNRALLRLHIPDMVIGQYFFR